MRGTRFSLIAFSVAATLLCGVSRAQDAASAKAFLVSVYHYYQNGYQEQHSGIDFDAPNANKYFHSSLLALERADVKANAGSIQAIDWDPICGCQDWNGIWNLKIEVHLDSPQRAIANVSFALFDPKDRPVDETNRLQITLVMEHGQWRIYDILDESITTFSVRKLLQDDLASLRKNPTPAPH